MGMHLRLHGRVAATVGKIKQTNTDIVLTQCLDMCVGTFAVILLSNSLEKCGLRHEETQRFVPKRFKDRKIYKQPRQNRSHVHTHTTAHPPTQSPLSFLSSSLSLFLSLSLSNTHAHSLSSSFKCVYPGHTHVALRTQTHRHTQTHTRTHNISTHTHTYGPRALLIGFYNQNNL